jgi:hypothetical protein
VRARGVGGNFPIIGHDLTPEAWRVTERQHFASNSIFADGTELTVCWSRADDAPASLYGKFRHNSEAFSMHEGRDARPEPCPAHLGQWPTFFISARAARRFTKSSATAFDHRLSRFAGRASKTFQLLTKAIGLPIGKCALDLSGQNSVLCAPLPARLGQPKNWTPALWCATTTVRHSRMCITRRSRAGDPQPSC